MNSNPQVKVIREFTDNGKHFTKGLIFTPNGVHRDYLMARGLVEVVKPADVAPPVELPRRSKAKGAAPR